MQRAKDLYEFGDITRRKYLQKREAVQKELWSLSPVGEDAENLQRLAEFMANISIAWEAANEEQRNKFAGCLFE